MSKTSLKQKTAKGIVWSSVERFSVQGVQFFVMLVMARFVSPGEYGIIGMLAIFLSLAQVIVDSGFSQAIIRKQNRQEEDICSIFFFNLLVGIFLYVIFYFIAPFVAAFYNKPELTLIMRVLCIGIVINSLGIVQRALFTIQVDFKTQAKASFFAAIISGVIGVWGAYYGLGVWALVIQQIISLTTNVIVLWLYSSWQPRLLFSFKTIKESFGFGSKLLLAGMIEAVFQNLHPIVIGKFFSTSLIGHYTRALQFSSLPSANISGIIQKVSYPVMCEIQNDNNKLLQVIVKLIRMLSFSVFPMMLVLVFFSDEIVLALLGRHWLFTSTLMRLLSISMMLYPFHVLNLNILIVKGRTDLYLKIDIIKKILTLVVLFITLPIGIVAMCYGQVFTSVISFFINSYYTRHLMSFNSFKQLREMCPYLLCGIIVGGFSFFVITNSIDNVYWRLISEIILFSIGYISATSFLNLNELKEIKQFIKKTNE